MTAERVTAATLAGEPIVGNDAPIGGLKVVTESGRFAARPSDAEAVNTIYVESVTSAARR